MSLINYFSGLGCAFSAGLTGYNLATGHGSFIGAGLAGAAAFIAITCAIQHGVRMGRDQ